MLTNIQLLRFVAAFAIVLYHAIPVFSVPEESGIVSWVKYFGFSGVDIFFVISGFIMWYTTWDKQGASTASIFIRRRFARIYSGYWPYLAIGIVIFMLFNSKMLEQKEILESILLVPVPIGERVIPVSWTLTFELYFYFLFFGMLYFVKIRAKQFIVILFCFLLLVNVTGSLFFGFYSQNYFSTVPVAVRMLISPYVLEFLAGSVICQIYLNRTIARNPLPPLLASLALFGAGAAYNALILEGKMATGYHVLERVLFFGSASVLLVYGVAALDRLGVVLFPTLSQVLGGASYSIYLSHTLIYTLFINILDKEALKQGYMLAVAIIVVLIYSIMHYKWIEQPLYGLMKRRLGVSSC